MLFLFCGLQWRIQGRGPTNPPPPPYPHFKTKLRPEGPIKKISSRPSLPLISGSGWPAPILPSPPYPKVWILRDATTAGFWFPLEMMFEEELQKFHSDNVTTQIKVVLLTGHAAMDLCYPDLGSDTSSVWKFCSCSWGNHLWGRVMSGAVFRGGYSLI